MSSDAATNQPGTLTVTIASEAAFAKIHQLNHAVFAEEIPQHERREDGLLMDAFHEINTYIVAMDGDELVGMVCYNPVRPFSLDRKLPGLDDYLPPHKKLVEVRLFAVKKERRKQGIGLALLKKLIPSLIAQGYDLGVISASLKELELYNNIGAVPFAGLVGTAEVPYQPLYFQVDKLKGVFKV